MAFIGSPIEDPLLQLDAGSSPVFESQTKPTGLIDSLDFDRSDDDSPLVASLEETGIVVISPVILTGFIPFSYGTELIFNRIWIDPTLINPPFISEDIAYDVVTWNAWITRSVDWTAEVVSGNTDGVLYDIDPLTITIPAFDNVIYEMILYAEGPATQNTTYTETIDGDDYDIEVRSIRVIGLDPEPNWAAGVTITYSFETVMFATERLREQRRPLRTRVRRGLAITFLTTDNAALKLRNLVIYGHDKAFACPIFPEKMDVSTCTQGTTAIVLTSSTTDKWNLNTQCQRVILVDHDAGANEIKTIDTIAANEITTVADIQTAFTPATTLCYPVFIGTLKNVNEKHHSNNVTEIKLSFEEFYGG